MVRSMPRSACAWPARSVKARAASLRLPRWPRFRVFKFADAGPWQGWLCSSLAGWARRRQPAWQSGHCAAPALRMSPSPGLPASRGPSSGARLTSRGGPRARPPPGPGPHVPVAPELSPQSPTY